MRTLIVGLGHFDKPRIGDVTNIVAGLHQHEEISELEMTIVGTGAAVFAVFRDVGDGAGLVQHGEELRFSPPARADLNARVGQLWAKVTDLPLSTKRLQVRCTGSVDGVYVAQLVGLARDRVPMATYTNVGQDPVRIEIGTAPGEPPDVYTAGPGESFVGPFAYASVFQRTPGVRLVAPVERSL